jgi:hypothetical protein
VSTHLQVLLCCHDSLAHICKDGCCLQHLIKVLLTAGGRGRKQGGGREGGGQYDADRQVRGSPERPMYSWVSEQVGGCKGRGTKPCQSIQQAAGNVPAQQLLPVCCSFMFAGCRCTRIATMNIAFAALKDLCQHCKHGTLIGSNCTQSPAQSSHHNCRGEAAATCVQSTM